MQPETPGEPRRSERRASARLPRVALRFTVALLVITVAVSPLLIVLGWLRVERQFESAMLRNARFSADEAAGTRAFPSGAVSAPRRAPADLEAIARGHRVRLRVLDGAGRLLQDFDFDHGKDLSQQAGGVVLGQYPGAGDRAFDDALGPISGRDEFAAAVRDGSAHGCRDLPAQDRVVCHAVRRHGAGDATRVVYVEDSSERPMSALYELVFQLKRLTLVVLPFALGLAWLAGRWVVRPLASLRDQVLAKVREPRPKPDLVARANDETQDLADAFNTLLERLAERRRSNEEFVADLVHEFKNPVSTIRACADALGTKALDAERAERIARLLLESSGRLDALVTQFLDLARAEAGMMREAWERVDLAALARGVVQSLRDDQRFSDTRLDVDAPDGAEVRGVDERLETVLRNLIDNAASFAGPGGHVVVRVRRTERDVVLAVSDDGPGISAEDRPHVFERFFTTRRHDRGTGLGLALVRAIVESHGGAVTVESEPGRGATFSAVFPRG